ncbi:MAG: hypothetical protein GY822_03345 [Deltaproteobacteria bacterium]|nr:hypothetical protein [Deltaproteobacteria bacterium]
MPEHLLEHENYTVIFNEEERVFEATWKGTVDQKSLEVFYKKTIPLLDGCGQAHYLNNYSDLTEISIAAHWFATSHIKE